MHAPFAHDGLMLGPNDTVFFLISVVPGGEKPSSLKYQRPSLISTWKFEPVSAPDTGTSQIFERPGAVCAPPLQPFSVTYGFASRAKLSFRMPMFDGNPGASTRPSPSPSSSAPNGDE